MKNSRSKKLLACFLAALGLTANISVTSAYKSYKDDERRELSQVVGQISEFMKQGNTESDNVAICYSAYNKLINVLKKIIGNRDEQDPGSILRSSLTANKIKKSELDGLYNINYDIKKKKYDIYGELTLMNNLIEKVQRLQGGYFTVWEDNVRTAVNSFADKITNMIKTIESEDNNPGIESIQDLKKEDSRSKTGWFSLLADIKEQRRYSYYKDGLGCFLSLNNEQSKESICETILKLDCAASGNTCVSDSQKLWCSTIIDKFLVLVTEKAIDADTMLEIYFVYDKFKDLLTNEMFIDDILKNNLESFLNGFKEEYNINSIKFEDIQYNRVNIRKCIINNMPMLSAEDKVKLLDKIIRKYVQKRRKLTYKQELDGKFVVKELFNVILANIANSLFNSNPVSQTIIIPNNESNSAKIANILESFYSDKKGLGFLPELEEGKQSNIGNLSDKKNLAEVFESKVFNKDKDIDEYSSIVINKDK